MVTNDFLIEQMFLYGLSHTLVRLNPHYPRAMTMKVPFLEEIMMLMMVVRLRLSLWYRIMVAAVAVVDTDIVVGVQHHRLVNQQWW